jgi:ADP-ribosylglycohydrolase
MLRKQPWLKPSSGFEFELVQAREEGKDISSYVNRVEEILSMDDSSIEKQKLAGEVYDEIQQQRIIEGYGYLEPSGLEGIKAERPDSSALYKCVDLSAEANHDKIYGAWLGRCAGCLLGKPVEGWHKERLTGLLRETDNYPIKYYISSDIPLNIKEKYGLTDSKGAWINQVKYMPEDDDTNYTLIGLKIFQQYGASFTPDDVAECWLANLPILHVCTAERVAYRNLVNCIYPPESASFRNPFREWIGAQIRADFFGYVTPGNPELGAEFAWRDACISHIKNGIYGEMFVAAMLSAAAVTSDVEDIIETGLSQIPSKSRLAEKIKLVSAWKKEGITWEESLNRIHSIYDEKNGHHWCHTISNAMIVCTALLFGDKDFEKSISIAVLGALDTDCNGATTGSILGMILGAKALPEKWIAPLNDQLKSGVDGFGLVKISEIAAETVYIAKKIKNLAESL